MISTSRAIGKLCAALILCIVIAAFVQHDYANRRQMSREEYLEKQGERYDKEVNRPPSFVLVFVASGILIGAFIGVYELIGFGVSRAARKLDGPVVSGE